MKESIAIKNAGEGASFTVRVNPRAGKTQFTGLMGSGPDAVLKIALAAPPVDGRANAELIAYLASVLDVPRSAVEVIAGLQSRNKVVRVKGRRADEILERLNSGFSPDKKRQLP